MIYLATVDVVLALIAVAHVLAFYGREPAVPVVAEPSWPDVWRQPADEFVHVYETEAT